MNQIELHKKIDDLIKKHSVNIKLEEVRALTSINRDAYHYFFTKADERWLDWLWNNGFLDAIKKKAEDSIQYRYRTPELDYLVKVAGKKPAKVVDIMLAVEVSDKHFNPEVVDRFLWICSTLPAEQLIHMVRKIRDEKWISFMGQFNRWGFEYEKILQTLANVKDYDSVLVLAEAILLVRTKEEIKKTTNRITTDNPFYFSDLSHTKVFEYLTLVDSEYAEKALDLTTRVMANVVLLGGESERDQVFPVEETFHLFDVDFFALESGQKKHLSHRDDVRELAAVVKILTRRLIGSKCKETDVARKLFEQYIKPLPDSRSMWRLRLFVLSLCPEAFKNELKKAFFRLFKTDRYHELISGTEYEKALQAGFSVLSESEKREYINQALEYFSKRAQDNEDQKWHKKYGWEILSSICSQLTEEENVKCEAAFGRKCDLEFEPTPSIGEIRGGTVRPRGPITLEEFGKLSIADIAKKLRAEWAPGRLRDQNTSDDFLNPLNAEGVSGLLRADILKRLQDYINNASLFFERDVLDQHYTYSFLRGVQEAIRSNKDNAANVNWNSSVILCIEIKKSGEAKPFDRETRKHDAFDAWLSGWTAVHYAMADTVQELLSENNGKTAIDFPKHRDNLFTIICYLLAYLDPVPEDEKIESAKMKTKSPGNEEYLVSDPFSMAINTVRGRAFQSFTLFIYQDGKKFTKEKKLQLSPDVKELYEAVLKNEETRALMFMFGHYLPSFYFRDKEWIRKLLLQIFPTEPEKKHLYLAAWEGLLTNNLYGKMFFDSAVAHLYSRAIKLKSEDYTKRQYFKEIDEALAIHLALAFVHFAEFKFEHELFKQFWSTENKKRHKEFISFIGRYCVSREAVAIWVKYNKVDVEKLKKFWDWALENCDADVLSGFGFWINKEHGVLETKWLAQHVRRTLEKTKGYIEWDYGLMSLLPIFAKEAPEDTLAILRAHLLEEIARHEPPRTWRLHVDAELIDIFKTIYEHPSTKEGVRTLINDLLSYRNGLFWGLKSVLDEDKLEKPQKNE